MEGLELLRRLLSWQAMTGAEGSRMQALLPGMMAPISFKQLFHLRRLENSPKLEDMERRRLRHLRCHLTRLLLQRQAAREIDRQIDTLSDATVRLPGGKHPVRFSDLPSLIAGTSDRSRRAELESRRVPTLRQLERLVLRAQRQMGEAARNLGLNPFDVDEECAERDTRTTLAGVFAANKGSHDLFRHVWSSSFESETVRVADLRWLREGGAHQSSLEEAKALPALRHLLSGLGLELSNVEGDPIRVSDEGLFTMAVAVSPPVDVRLVCRRESGLWGHIKLFEAAGEAVCQANVQRLGWELRSLGPQVGARTMGYLLGLVWLEPGWWARYRQVVPGREAGRARGANLNRAGPAEAQVHDLLRTTVLVAAVRLRLQGVVMPIIRAVLEGAPSRTYEGVFQPSGSAPTALFAQLMHSQLGLKLDRDQSLTYLDELLPPGRPAFDPRAYALAHQLLELLRREEGGDWFNRPGVGGRLISALCHGGSAVTASQIARKLELGKGPDLEAPWRTLRQTWEGLHVAR